MRQPQEATLRRRFGFQWHITDACDQRCKHCYIFAEDRGRPLSSMDLPQMREVIRRCDDFARRLGTRPPIFAITGGDPVLSPHFGGLMELLSERGEPFVMMGNPFHLDDVTLQLLKESGCAAYQVSLDGMQETHDWFRKPGSFEATLACIPKIHAAGIDAHVMMTVSDVNCAELPDVMEAASNAGADVFGFARYVPTSADKELGINPIAYREVLRGYLRKRAQLMREGTFTEFHLKDHLFTLYLYEEGIFKPPAYSHTMGEAMPAGCHCAHSHLDITSDGSVYACRRAHDTRLGNVFDDDLVALWEKATLTYRRYDAMGSCGRCALASWCRGCPAVASGSRGSFFAGDSQCWHVVEELSSAPIAKQEP